MTSSIQNRSYLAPESTKRKVSSHWKLLKALINSEKEENAQRREEQCSQVVSHGVHHVGKINTGMTFGKRLKSVAFNPASNIYATILDDGKITLLFANGESKKIKSDEYYGGIIYATKTKQCVCWSDSDKLMVIYYFEAIIVRCDCAENAPVSCR